MEIYQEEGMMVPASHLFLVHKLCEMFTFLWPGSLSPDWEPKRGSSGERETP